MFDLGTQELIVIFIVAFLVFGPKKLPELGRTLGKGIRELKEAMRGVKESIEEASDDVSEEIKGAKTDFENAVHKGIDSQFSFKDEFKKDTKGTPEKPKSPAAEEDSKEKEDPDKNG